MSLSLVIEGGGLRGAFAVGALAELDRLLPIRPTRVFATSSGAPNAAYFTTGQIEAGVRIWRERTHSAQLVDYWNLVRSAHVMKIEQLVDVFRDEIRLDASALAASKTRLDVALTDVDSGAAKLVTATPANVFDLLTAAMAIPIAYGETVSVERGRYIDGGFRAPVAIREALAENPDKLIVVLTKPRGHRRKHRPLSEWLQCRSYRQFPAACEAIRSKWRGYNATMDLLDELEGAGRALIVRPPGELPVGRLSRSKQRIHAAIELGRETVGELSSTLARYLDRPR